MFVFQEIGNAVLFAPCLYGVERAVVVGEDGETFPAGIRQAFQTQDFFNDCLCLDIPAHGRIPFYGEAYDADAALAFGVGLRPNAAVGVLPPFGVDGDRVPGFQAVGHSAYHAVGGGDNVLRAAVVESQEIGRIHAVFLLKTEDVVVAAAVVGKDILVVVADCKNGQLVFIIAFPACQCGNQPVMPFADILVLVYEDIAESRHDAFARFVPVAAAYAV